MNTRQFRHEGVGDGSGLVGTGVVRDGDAPGLAELGDQIRVQHTNAAREDLLFVVDGHNDVESEN